jgi:hypothetical protein
MDDADVDEHGGFLRENTTGFTSDFFAMHGH